jgi:hypothetical protein
LECVEELRDLKYLKKSHRFEGWVFLRHQVYRKTPTLLDPVDRAISYLWTLLHYRLVNAVTKPISTLCRQNAELLIVKAGDTYSSYLWASKG